MPDIQVEKDSKFKKLSKEAQDDLASKISDWWNKFHSKRTSQLTTANELMKYIYLNQANRNRSAEWKSNIKENKLYTTWDAMKSVMWREIWSDEDQMFDVAGVTKADDENADHQKEAIVHALRKMNAGVQFDVATDYWGAYGDFVYKIDWKSRKKKVKRYDKFNGYVVQELPLEENANIEAINPVFFNFDSSKYRYGDEESWDKCIKIYKRFASLEEIKANPIYKLTKEQELDLKTDDNTEITDKLSDDELATATKYGDLYEVLYLQGDFKFNGVYYSNVVAEVLAGKYLIFFDENPIFINPFVYETTQRDPVTGRGISPLKSILELVKANEELINKAADIATLNANPCHWVSDTFLKEKYKNGVVDYAPGKVLEYENSYQGGFPQAVKFDASGIADVINVIANDISDASAINANTMGNITQGKRTATEISIASQGSDSRTAMKLDYIYQANIKVIEKVAELLAMFALEPELLLIDDEGKRVAIEVTNAIRQGNYNYIYEDRNALIGKRAKIQEAFTMLNASASNPVLMERIDWVESLKTGLESLGFDNADKFFQEPSEVDQVAEFVKKLPQEYQQAIMQNITPMLQQAQMAINGGVNEQR